MSGVNLAEVLLDEMVILDCEPFKDKENMFDDCKIRRSRIRVRRKGLQRCSGIQRIPRANIYGKLRCNTSWKMQRSSETRNWIL